MATIEKMHEDVVFQQFLLDIQREVANIQDIFGLKNYLEDGKLSEKEKETIHSVFGYNDKTLYWKERELQNKRLDYLAKRYNISKASDSQKRIEVEKAFTLLRLFKMPNLPNVAMKVEDPCESIRLNCIAAVAAEAAVMHLGCAALDLSVIAGIICHGAALAYQYSAGNKCNLEAQKCKEAE